MRESSGICILCFESYRKEDFRWNREKRICDHFKGASQKVSCPALHVIDRQQASTWALKIAIQYIQQVESNDWWQSSLVTILRSGITVEKNYARAMHYHISSQWLKYTKQVYCDFQFRMQFL